MNVEDSAIALTERLARLLETEFEALSGRDLERLESLTEQREGLLKQLLYFKQTNHELWTSEAFSNVRSALRNCQELHKRNELLLARQVEAVREALGVLRKSSDDADLYDRLGRLAQRRNHLFSDDV